MKLTINDALKKGVDAHKSGNIKEADQYYTAILQAQPKHPDANHNMGVLAVGIGKVETSLSFFKKALESNSKVPQYWLSYLESLLKLNRIPEAKEVLKEARNQGMEGKLFQDLESKFGHIKNQLEKETIETDPPKENLQLLISLFNNIISTSF